MQDRVLLGYENDTLFKSSAIADAYLGVPSYRARLSRDTISSPWHSRLYWFTYADNIICQD